MPLPKKNPSNRTKNSLGKEKVGDKLGKNKPKRQERKSTALKGSMKRSYTNYRSR